MEQSLSHLHDVVNGSSKKNKLIKFRKFLSLYLMVLPGIIFIVIFNYIPMLGIQLAFKEWDFIGGVWGSPWVGLANFEFITNQEFWKVVANTFTITGLRLILGFPAPIILALLFNEIKYPLFKKVMQTISYIPFFVSWIVVVGLMYSLLSLDGAVNEVLKNVFHMAPALFLGSESWFLPLVIGSGIWKSIGFGTIIYLASIAGINPELFEAAIIDGAGRFKRVLHITIPCLLPTISVLLVLNIPSLLSAGADQILPMLNDANRAAGEVIDTYIIRLGIGQIQYSLTTAIGLVLSVISTIMVVTTNNLAKKLGGQGIW